MVEGAILVVDAGEGPLAQTKFVLAKALKYNIRPLLLLNKVDKPSGMSSLFIPTDSSLIFSGPTRAHHTHTHILKHQGTEIMILSHSLGLLFILKRYGLY